MRTALIVLFLACLTAEAHIGSPNVFLEGKAGEYPVRVVIRPPDVVPGLAEITIRVQASVQRVTVLPVFSKTGRKGSPSPDEAKLVRGETNLYSAQLWLMKAGAYSVDVTVEGQRGAGTLVVPVNSIATNTRPMSWSYGAMLSFLAIILFLGALKIVEAVFTESQLEPGMIPARKDVWRGRIAMALAAGALSLLLFAGKKWWDLEDGRYRQHALYKRPGLSAVVRADGDQLVLRLKVDTTSARGQWTPLIADHGKLMHLFLVRQGKPDAFAHLHPVSRTNSEFEVVLPPLPAGDYHVYADVTHEDGFSETLVSTTALPEASLASYKLWLVNSGEPICSTAPPPRLTENRSIASDRDDSWFVGPEQSTVARGWNESGEVAGRTAVLTDGYRMVWGNAEPLMKNSDVSLRFSLVKADGQPAVIEPYMGMLGHAVVRRQDGQVFAHLHPVGTFSMAAQKFFVEGQLTEGGEPKVNSTSAPANPLSAWARMHAAHLQQGGPVGQIGFPYAFPRAGSYRIWVQLKSAGRIWTGAFDVNVSEGPERRS